MQKPIADVFTWPDEQPQLIGGRCDDCGATTFPTQSRCPRCGRTAMSELPLPRQGTLGVVDDPGVPPGAALCG